MADQQNLPPEAVFEYEPRMPDPGKLVKFKSRSFSRTSTIVGQKWDFDDGTVTRTTNPAHRFEEEGSYDVTLTVTDAEGKQDSDTRAVVVDPKVNFLSPGSTTKGGEPEEEGEIETETEDAGGWKGLDNILNKIRYPEIEKFRLGWSCPVGVGPFKIDVCAILAAPIEILINKTIEVARWMTNHTLDLITDWLLDLLVDIVDGVLALPAPLESLSDYAIDWVVYGEDDAKMNLAEEFQSVIRGEAEDALDELGLSEEAIRDTVERRMEDLEDRLPFDLDEPDKSFAEEITQILEEHGLTGEQIGEEIRERIQETFPDLQFFPPQAAHHASFVYQVSDLWLEQHGLDPDHFQLNEIHIPADLYSDFFTAAMSIPPKQYNEELAPLLAEPYQNRDGIMNVLDLSFGDFGLEEYQWELFFKRTITQLIQSAHKQIQAIKSWMMGEVETLEPTWEEVLEEISDLLEEPIKDSLKEMGFIVPPDLEKIEATAPEAIEAMQKLSRFLDNVEATTPEEIEELDDETGKIIEVLKTLQGEGE